ncbi:MAG: T9SS type A sorting domain-containing protein [bacterium]
MKKFSFLILFLFTLLPLLGQQGNNFFIENKGQWDSNIRFLAKVDGMNAWITNEGIYYDFFVIEEKKIDDIKKEKFISDTYSPINENHKTQRGHVVKMNLVGQNQVIRYKGLKKLETYYNYFLTGDSTKWASYVPLYKEVIIEDIYSGIDVKYYFNGNQLRYDYLVNPGGNPEDIIMQFEGQDSISISSKNEIELQTSICTFKHNQLRTYQFKNEKTSNIESQFQLNSDNSIGISIANYDKSRTLIIDPAVEMEIRYSSYLNYIGNPTCNANQDNFFSIKPLMKSTLDTLQVIIYKLELSNSNLDSMLFTNYVPSSEYYNAFNVQSIKLLKNDKMYIIGQLGINDINVTPGCYSSDIDYSMGIFKYDRKTNKIVFATMFSRGATAADELALGRRIFIDENENIFLAGIYVESIMPKGLPITNNAFQKTYEPQPCPPRYNILPFVSKINSTGSKLVYSTFLGGCGRDFIDCLFVNNNGEAIIVGGTASPDFPIKNSFDSISNSHADTDYDAFIAQLNEDGSDIVFSSYLGGDDYDWAKGVIFDSMGMPIVIGTTGSKFFPTTANAYSRDTSRTRKLFITKFDSNYKDLVFSTVFPGGSKFPSYDCIEIDKNNNIILCGRTTAWDFPTTTNAIEQSYIGSGGGFISVFDPYGSNLIYSSYWKGIITEIFKDDSVFALFGETKISDYPLTDNAFSKTMYSGTNITEHFVTQITLNVTAQIMNASLSKIEVCTNDTLMIRYNLSGEFKESNWFVAQLSDKNGFFDNPINIGRSDGNTASEIIATIPKDLESGTGYKIRIVSYVPAITSQPTFSFTIFESPDKPTITVFDKILASSINIGNQWFLNGEAIADENKQFLTAKETGYYSVQVLDDKGCKSEMSDSVFIEFLEVEDNSYESCSLKVEPNPYTEMTKISWNMINSEFVSIVISNIIGKEVSRLYDNILLNTGQHFIEFDAGELQSGIYFCTLKAGAYSKTVKMVVVR